MKKQMFLIVLLAIGGVAIAELANTDFEDGMSGWSTWGSGSGSGPLGSMPWTLHEGYIDTTGNGVADSNNFMNLTTSSQIGYYEYDGFGYVDAYRSSSAEIAPANWGDWFNLSVWAKDVGGYGGRVELEFFWEKCPKCAFIPPDIFYFDVTGEWLYYEALAQAPGGTIGLRPAWGNPEPGTEIGIDNVELVLEPCDYVLAGDRNGNCKVDAVDFAKLAKFWQISYDMSDLAEMAANWLIDCDVTPGDPACVPE